MSIGSVWDWSTLTYSYWNVPDQAVRNGGWVSMTRSSPRGGTNVGSALEDILPILPPGSQKVGEGIEAVGRIYVMPEGLAMGSLPMLVAEPVPTPEPVVENSNTRLGMEMFRIFMTTVASTVALVLVYKAMDKK